MQEAVFLLWKLGHYLLYLGLLQNFGSEGLDHSRLSLIGWQDTFCSWTPVTTVCQICSECIV